MRTPRGTVLTCMLGCAAACSVERPFVCERDDQCRRVQGDDAVCEANGACSFSDGVCPTSLRRYDEYASDGLAGSCVGGCGLVAPVQAGVAPPAFAEVADGVRYAYTATGCRQVPDGYARPDGTRYPDPGCAGNSTGIAQRIADATYTCPGLISDSLVGRVGDGSCVQLGPIGSFVAPADGQLLLFANTTTSTASAIGWTVCLAP